MTYKAIPFGRVALYLDCFFDASPVFNFAPFAMLLFRKFIIHCMFWIIPLFFFFLLFLVFSRRRPASKSGTLPEPLSFFFFFFGFLVWNGYFIGGKRLVTVNINTTHTWITLTGWNNHSSPVFSSPGRVAKTTRLLFIGSFVWRRGLCGHNAGFL